MSAYGDAWMFLGCFAYTLVSAIFPWINAELLVLSLPLMASSPTELLALLLVATAGQMLGKCAVYWSGRGAGSPGRAPTFDAGAPVVSAPRHRAVRWRSVGP